MTPEELRKEALKEKKMRNLIPFNERTPEERKRIAAMGAKKGNEIKRRNATIREVMTAILDDKAYTGNITVDMVRRKNPSLTNRDAIAIAMVAQAILKQDVRAFVAIRDTVGESPTQKVDLGTDGKMVIRVETLDDDDFNKPDEEEEEE